MLHTNLIPIQAEDSALWSTEEREARSLTIGTKVPTDFSTRCSDLSRLKLSEQLGA
jgi:hypothetical protein